MARFGDKQHAWAVRDLLDNTQPIAAKGIATGSKFTTQLGDLAVVTIAVLHKIPLEDLGLRGVDVHPNIGFSLKNIGFKNEADREAAKTKVNQLLDDAARR